MEAPIRFEPIYQERVWGGRWLAGLPGRRLPSDAPVGESWEVVDRAEAQSVVTGGRWHGATLHDLWSLERERIFGVGPGGDRFPLLIKILDARETLSVQVHPPAAVAAELGGEPKTEMWYLLDAEPGAVLYAGLRHGVDRETFSAALEKGRVEETLHRIEVKTGDAMFIPSGRVHAIGAGCRILEVQQNSDTTYRVFDWNRVGLDGRPRTLHIGPSMRSINFDDAEPQLQPRRSDGRLVENPLFGVDCLEVCEPVELQTGREWAIAFVAQGPLAGPAGALYETGATLLLPAGFQGEVAPAETGGSGRMLRIVGPRQGD